MPGESDNVPPAVWATNIEVVPKEDRLAFQIVCKGGGDECVIGMNRCRAKQLRDDLTQAIEAYDPQP